MQSFKNRMDVVRFLSFTHVFLSWSIDWLETYLDTCIKVRFWLPALRWICSPGRIQVEGDGDNAVSKRNAKSMQLFKIFIYFFIYGIYSTRHTEHVLIRPCPLSLLYSALCECVVFSKCVPCMCSKCVPCARLRVCCVCVRVRVCVCVAGFRTLICLCVNAGEFVFHAHACVYVWLLEKKKEKKSSF